jgi:hypothetical protein
MAAELAVLPITNDQPAKKPGHSPRGRVLRGELRRRRRIAERDEAGDQQSDQQARPGRRGGGRERGEDARADHRAEADRDRVAEAEAPGERAVRGR